MISTSRGRASCLSYPWERESPWPLSQRPKADISIFVTSSIAFAWCMQEHVHLAAVLVLGFFTGCGGTLVGVAMIYGQDLYPERAGSVSASSNLIRCLFAAIGTSVIQLLYEDIGAGWSIVIFAGLCVCGIPMLLLVTKMGPKWRAKRRAKAERKAAAKAEKKGAQTKDRRYSQEMQEVQEAKEAREERK